jgi:hypothetical protein
VKAMKRLTDGRVGTRLKEIIKDNNKIPYRDLPGQLAKSITPGIPIPSATTCQRFLKQNGYKIYSSASTQRTTTIDLNSY